MRAYLLSKGMTGPKDLKLVDRPDPQPGAKEILVRMRAASLNYRDQMIAHDTYMGNTLQGDAIPLSDGAGEVIAVGPGVTRFKIGDRIMSTFFKDWIAGPWRDQGYSALGQNGVDGVLAELVVFNQEDAVRIPDRLSFEEASCLSCAALTAWTSIYDAAGVRAGQSVLALGTGGVSVFAIQFAKAAGCSVIVTSSSEQKLAKAKALGADELINYRAIPEWDGEVRRLTGGCGVDHVVEVGGVGTLERSCRALANNGSVGLIGFLAEGAASNPWLVLPRWGRLVKVVVGSRESFEAMNRAIVQNQIKPVIDKIFPFEQAIDAYTYGLSGAHFGKVVITI